MKKKQKVSFDYNYFAYASALRSKLKKLRKSGLKYREIAEYLNRHKIMTVKGKKWTPINAYLFGTGRNISAKRELRS